MSRGSTSVLLVLAGAVLSLVGGVVLYVRAEVVETQAFSDRAVDSLRDSDVRRVVAREVAAQLAGSTGLGVDATAPELESTVDRAIQTPTFERAFRAAAAETHTALFESEDDPVFFDVPNAGRALATALERIAPGLADSIPVEAETRLLEIERQNPGVQALQLADELGVLGAVLLLLGLGSLAAGVVVAPERRVALTRVALALGLGSALGALALVVFGQLLAAGAKGGYALANDDVSPAVWGVWSAYAGDLVTWGLVCAGLGLGLAAALVFTARRSRVTAPHAL